MASLPSVFTRNRSRPRVRPKSLPWQRRVILVWSLLMLAMVVLVIRLLWLQLVQGSHLQTLAQAQRLVPSQPYPIRYPISDRQGNLLAMDRTVYTVYAHPRLFRQSVGQMAIALSPILETAEAELVSQLSRQPTGIRLADRVTAEVADRLRKLKLDGLELIPSQERFYPEAELFAPVLGFINRDGQPQAGLEMAQQAELQIPEIDQTNRSQSMADFEAAKATLRLSLDSRLQRLAQQSLAAVVAKHGAKRGTVMVMEVNSGALLALATVPTYDPNAYYKADMAAFKNWAVSDLYEPGSTFKPVNVAIALENRAITAHDRVNDSGQMRFGKWTIKNHDYAAVGARGPISITDVLRYSSNVGMVRIMQKLTPATYRAWLDKLGLEKPAGIDLPNEAPGHGKSREDFLKSPVEPATTAFGQGFSLTPVKLLQLHAALANGGKLITPHVIDGLVAEDGKTLWHRALATPTRVFSSQTSQTVMTMMEAVVQDGTGSPAQITGYRIGGKTGTAQKALATGGYGRGRITSFVGILPIDSPRYAILAVIDEPQGDNAYGSTVAAPLVKEVMEALVVLEGLAPASMDKNPSIKTIQQNSVR
ncbi:MAG: penicillin-binding protein 2 [Cyanobacteria bacterium REEB459]|nr:penicillin-binding protein 2 [Cyanobacteria bacterium REEB459]